MQVRDLAVAMLSSDYSTRNQAELFFIQSCANSGIGPELLSVVMDVQTPENIRQSCGIMLKKLIQMNWSYDDEEADVEINQSSISDEHASYEKAMKDAKSKQIEIQEQDKVILRNNLPTLLADDLTSIRTTASMCIATIAQSDFPDKCPELLPFLIKSVGDFSNMRLVQGSLECLSIIIEDVICDSILTTIPTLFPALVHIIQSKGSDNMYIFNNYIRSIAMGIFSIFILNFTALEDPGERSFEKNFSKYITPILPTLVPACFEILSSPLPNVANIPAPITYNLAISYVVTSSSLSTEAFSNSLMFNVRAAAVKLVSMLISYFPRLMKNHVGKILETIEKLLSDTLPFYIANITNPLYMDMILPILQSAGLTDAMTLLSSIYIDVMDDSKDNSFVQGLSQLMDDIVSFLSLLTDLSKTIGKSLRLRLSTVVPSVASLTMLTNDDIESFELDIGSFSAAEDAIDYDTFSATGGYSDSESGMVRKQASALICNMLESWPVSAAEAVAASVKNMCVDADNVAGSLLAVGLDAEQVWRYREAATLCVGQLLFNTKAFGKQKTLTIQDLLNQILIPALSIKHEEGAAQFLTARGVWFLSPVILHLVDKLQAVTNAEDVNTFYSLVQQNINFLTQHLQNTQPLIIRASAARSVRVCGMSFILIDSFMLRHQANLALTTAGLPELPNNEQESLERVPIGGKHLVNSLPIAYECIIQHHVNTIMSSLCDLLTQTDSENLISILKSFSYLTDYANKWYETINDYGIAAPVLQLYSTDSSGVVLPHLGGIITQMGEHAHIIAKCIITCWSENTNNHEVGELIDEIMKGLCSIGIAQDNMISVVYPLVKDLLSKHHDDNNASVKTLALSLLSTLLRTSYPGPFSINMSTLQPLTTQYNDTITDISHALSYSALSTPSSLVPSLSAFPNTYSAIPRPNCTFPAGDVCLSLLPLILSLANEDIVLARGACAISSTIIAIFGSFMKENISTYLGVVEQCVGLCMKFITNTTSDSSDSDSIGDMDRVTSCRLFTQLLVNFSSVLPSETTLAIIRELSIVFMTTSFHSLKVAIAMTLSRVALLNPQSFFQYLTMLGTIEVNTLEKVKPKLNKKTGRWTEGSTKPITQHHNLLHGVINGLCSVYDDLHSPYPCRLLSVLFMTIISNSDLHSLCQSLTINGELIIEPKARRTTRSTGTKPQYTQVNAITKMLSCLCISSKRIVDNQMNVNENDNEALFNEDDSENEFDEREYDFDDDAQNPDGVGSGDSIFADASTFNSMMLSDMFDFDDDDNFLDQGVDAHDYPESAYDLVNAVNLPTLSLSFFTNVPMDLIQAKGPEMNQDTQQACMQIMNYLKRQ